MNTGSAIQPAQEGGHVRSRASGKVLTAFGNIMLVAAGFALLMSACGIALDVLLLRSHEGTGMTMIISNVLAGVIAGALVFRLLQFGRERRVRIEERLQTISDMNHHIRNALQVISFSLSSSQDKNHVAEIHDALDRIQWALREILPRVEPTFTPFEGRARKRMVEGELQKK